MTLVVSDTSPLNYLILIDHQGVLPQLFDSVVIPKQVFEELSHPKASAKVRAWLGNLPAWLRVDGRPLVGQFPDLDDGENHALTLALELGTRAVLMDERLGRKKAVEVGLEPFGVVGVLEAASAKGFIQLAAAFDELKKTNYRIEQRYLDEALKRDLELSRSRNL